MATMTLVVGACFMVNGQDTTANGNNMGRNMQGDAAFVQKNIRDNQHEVDMSQMALDKSGNQKIKSLAQQMVKDHSRMLQDLQKVQGIVNEGGDSAINNDNMSRPGDTGTASNQTDMAGRKTSRTNDTSNMSSNTNPGMNNSSSGDSSTMQDSSMLGSNSDMQGHDSQNGMHDNMMMNASGKEFDEMWVSQMLDAHNAKLDELKRASSRITNPELKTLIQQAIPKVKMHRDRLEQLSKSSSTGKSGSSKMKSGSR